MKDGNNFYSLKPALFMWGWGILFLAELLLGEIFVNRNRNELILIFGFLFLIIGVLLVPVPFLLFPKKGKVPKGQGLLHTTVIVDSGIYGLIRHPQYLGWLSIIFSFILLRQHIIITAIGIIAMFLLYFSTIEEEKDLINKFGLEYRKYKKEVPRWNLPLGILNYFLRKKRMR